MLLGNFFYDYIVHVVIDICFKKQSFVLIFHGDICYFRHGQGRDNMMEYSPVPQNDYTVFV